MRLPLRSFGVYLVATILTISMFIVLHLVGNLLPPELAVQRMADEFRATPGKDWGMRGGNEDHTFYYCEFSSTVVGGAGAAPDNAGSALLNAVILPTTGYSQAYCAELKAAVFEGVWPERNVWANPRHWLGGKALYAIALRHLTVREFHLAIKVLIYCGFALVALALFCIGWRALVVGAPLVLGLFFFSAVERHFSPADGLPFAWALFAPALGALLLKRDSSASTVRVFFYFAGMVSHYFWLYDGGNFVAATLIGLVVWLTCEQHAPRQRVWYAASCVGVYAAGFAVSIAARVAIAVSMLEYHNVRADYTRHYVSINFLEYPGTLLERILAPWPKDLAGRDFGTFQEEVGIDAPTFAWFSLIAASALVLTALIAVHHIWRRKPVLLLDVLWLVALLLPSCPHFLVPSDDPSRAARLMVMPLAVCWCCPLVVLTKFKPRRAAICMGGVGAAAALLYAGTQLASHWRYEAKLRDARLLSVAEEEAFGLYLLAVPAGGRRELIYRKSPCADKDLETTRGTRKRFFLHLMTDDPAVGFVDIDFSFYEQGQRFLGTCHASVFLPDYAQRIRTGQYAGEENIWEARVDFDSDNGNTPEH